MHRLELQAGPRYSRKNLPRGRVVRPGKPKTEGNSRLTDKDNQRRFRTAAWRPRLCSRHVCVGRVLAHKLGVKAKQWVKDIEKQSVVVSEDWLRKYKEAPLQQHGEKGSEPAARVVPLKLPTPSGMDERIATRRGNLA